MPRPAAKIVLTLLLAIGCVQQRAGAQVNPKAPVVAEQETKYLAFQIFTYGPNPIIATMGEGAHPQPARFPDKAVLRDYIEDIKGRIGTVGDPQTRLAVVLGHLAFDHGDAETTQFIEMGFELALETDVAVGFHIDDSMFWGKRKDLLSDPNNVEAMDWDGTPCTGRILNWGKEPSAAPPQMCFNSKVIQREVQQRAALIGKAIQAGVKQLQQRNRPELFAGVIAGSETQIGQDFKTGKYLGYRALLNRGFSREHPPQDMDLEREKVVQEWIELWTTGLADAGVSPQRIYSHICFLSRRAFSGDDKDITYMKRKGEISYSQHNHFTPPSVAFGKNRRPGFSIYPQGGLFEDIYEEVAKHKQVGWASCEGTNMQPESGPGQTGMNMETYLAKMFNHGATLVNVFAWGIGGEAMKDKIGFRVVTEGEEALRAYRKFLKGEPLIEGETVASLTDRLPPKIHRIQKELPAWIEKTGNTEAAALMQQMQEQMKAKNFDEVEKTADSILKMMGASAPAAGQSGENKPQQAPPSNPPSDEAAEQRVAAKVERVEEGAHKWEASGRDTSAIARTMEEKVKPLLEAGKFVEAEAELDRVLEQLNKGVSGPAAGQDMPLSERLPPKIQKIQQELTPWIENGGDKDKATALMQKLKEQLDAKNFEEADKTADSILKMIGKSAQAPTQDIPVEVREKLAHNIGCSFLLFRDKVQEELKVTPEQKEKLEQHLREILPDAMQALQQGKGERDKYNQKTHEEMAAVLKETLNEGQRTRLHQLELQKDGLFGPAWNLKELQITDEQRKQFMAPAQETQQKSQALMAEIQKGANPDEIRPKALQLRLDLEVQLEALLTDAQKKQWKEMLGQRVDPSVLYGGLSSAQDNPTEGVHQRVAAKIERVTQAVKKMAESGSDPSAILKTMEEKVGPLLDAGKFVEAEAELDRVLEQLKPDEKSTDSPTTQPASSKASAASEKSRYLIFWYSPEKVGELVEQIGMKGDGKTRLLGFGMPNPTYEFEAQLPRLIRIAFAAAREHDIAVMLNFDFHTRWQTRPDLWNWFDPNKPGYNPDNKYNVEWHGWDGPPDKVRYLNWGVLERTPPNICFTSKRTRAEVTRIVSKIIGPVLREEIGKLKAEGKEDLFAGVLVGSETYIDDYSKPHPDVAKMMREDGVAAGPLGYRALLDRGFSADHPPDDFRRALANIVQETIGFWCQQFVDAGIPADKLYPHVVAPAPIEAINGPIWTAFNKYSRPGWTTYSVTVLRESFNAIYDELEKHGSPAWAGVEANAGVPGSVVDWETYLAWHYNHGCVLVGVNTDGSKEHPNRLWDSAFGKEAIAAYHKFLTGQPLVEKPVAMDNQQFRIQTKIKQVRDGIQRWHGSGRDPSAVGKLMEGAQPLANAEKLDELEKLVDQALEMLGETEKAPDVYRHE